MPTGTNELTDEERAELEQLRAEKAARAKADEAARERRELEHLKREKAEREASDARDAHSRELRERNARIMEPDDDLSMPLGQKIVLVGLFAVVAVVVFYMLFGH